MSAKEGGGKGHEEFKDFKMIAHEEHFRARRYAVWNHQKKFECQGRALLIGTGIRLHGYTFDEVRELLSLGFEWVIVGFSNLSCDGMTLIPN